MTVSPPAESPVGAWTAFWLAEDIELIAHGVRNRSWIDGGLGIAGLDALAFVSDPVGWTVPDDLRWRLPGP